MLEDLEDDTHLCIKCSQTIVGLENYVQHRKNNCNKSSTVSTSLNREIIDTSHPYQSFGFNEPSSSVAKHDKQYNFNYEIETVHHEHDDVVSDARHILPSPMHASEKASDYKTDPNKSLTESYDYNYGLGADVFFSLLNLQSSSKTRTQTVTSNVAVDNASTSMIKSESEKIMHSKTNDTTDLSHSRGHMDDWIGSGAATTSGTDKLMKAVNEISGTKKLTYDSPHYSFEYSHDHGSPDVARTEFDDDEIDDDNETDLVEEEDDMIPPRTHTGGKWRPSERNHHQSTTRWYERWDSHIPMASSTTESNEELADNVDEFDPSPSYTKGKWIPGTKIIKLERHDSETFSEQFWCRSCNRRLSSRIVYERHLKSKLHTKRSQPENDLEMASLSLPLQLPHIYDAITGGQVPMQIAASDTNPTQRKKRNDETAPYYIDALDSNGVIKKRKRRFNFIKCNVCKTRLRTFLYGKHLISHYHYRRMFKNPTESYATILDNIHRIVLQSPYQCKICTFYANTEEMFLYHWDSTDHISNCNEHESFWCSFCKFVCQTNNEMRAHLIGKTHQEVILAINRSVPIIIRPKRLIKCENCHQEFSLNIELRKHAYVCSASKPLGTASDQYQGKYYCNESMCNQYFASLIVYQRHMNSIHGIKCYFCGPCQLSFSDSEEAKRHRVSSQHKIKAARIRAKKSLKKECTACGLIQDDLLLLKEHLRTVHPDINYPCYLCGQKFIFPQELSRHIRDKVCKYKELHTSVKNSEQDPSGVSLLELPIITDMAHDVAVPDLIVGAEPHSEFLYMESVENNTENDLKSQENLSSVNENTESATDDISVLWACRQCEFRTPTEAECIFHEMLHKWNICNNSKIPCPICDRLFSKSSLRCHLRLHTNERMFSCTTCPLKFTRKANLKEHIQRIHMKTPTGKKSTKRKLRQTSSTPYNDYICTICKKHFQKRNLLEQHMHCHKEVIPVKIFKCAESDCLFSGRSAGELRVHQATHSTERNFACTFETCDYRTKTNALLKRHIKSQHQDNTMNMLQCNHCNFKTTISGHLKRHIRIHAGERPYQCPHCTYASNNSENLRKHVIITKKHPGRFLYECKLCSENGEKQPFATNISKDYKFHLHKVHNQKK